MAQSCKMTKRSLAEAMKAMEKLYRDNQPVPPELPKPASMLPNAPPPEPTYERPKRRVRLQRRAADEPTSAKT